MRQRLAWFVSLLLGLACVACGAASPARANPAPYSLTDLLVDLQDKRATVTVDAQPMDRPFQTPAKRVEVDGVSFFVYEFADPQTMEQVAGSISADRSSIAVSRRQEDGSEACTRSNCTVTPYLYKRGTLIVLIYDHDPVYDHARARRMLHAVLGPPFAGGQQALASNN